MQNLSKTGYLDLDNYLANYKSTSAAPQAGHIRCQPSDLLNFGLLYVFV